LPSCSYFYLTTPENKLPALATLPQGDSFVEHVKSINLARWTALTSLVIALVTLCAPVKTLSSSAIQKRALVIRNAGVFDGERIIPRATVVVQDGKIVSVGERALIPDGAEVISGEGVTLLPGLIDSHTHSTSGRLSTSGRPLLRQTLMFGVTTNLDMFTMPQFAVEMRREQAEGKATDRADLFSAGTVVTAPGGHGTQSGFPIPTITEPAEAQSFVDERIAEGSDYIKIVLEDGNVRGTRPTLSAETLKAVVAAAKRRGKLAVVHVSDENLARQAIEAGADGLVHIYFDGQADVSFARLAKSRGVFVIPTLTLIESTLGVPTGDSLASDARLAPYIQENLLENLRKAKPKPQPLGPNESYSVAADIVRLLRGEGVPILAGSDCPNVGTAHGVSLHRELELLVQAGLTPLEALRAATSAPAKAFRLKDRGSIKPGMRADLLLVRGDPTQNILATRDIVRVWKEGVGANRDGYRMELQKEKDKTKK
jgi:imidazolonepropionase-like amidohydrolase